MIVNQLRVTQKKQKKLMAPIAAVRPLAYLWFSSVETTDIHAAVHCSSPPFPSPLPPPPSLSLLPSPLSRLLCTPNIQSSRVLRILCNVYVYFLLNFVFEFWKSTIFEICRFCKWQILMHNDNHNDVMYAKSTIYKIDNISKTKSLKMPFQSNAHLSCEFVHF